MSQRVNDTHQHETINYVEFPSKNLTHTKRFFSDVFGWTFEDYGPEYTAFSKAGLDGGFFQSDACSTTGTGAALIVFYSHDLAATQSRIEANGGEIVQAIFGFPGGQRFHFTDPTGNEFAVWTKTHSGSSHEE